MGLGHGFSLVIPLGRALERHLSVRALIYSLTLGQVFSESVADRGHPVGPHCIHACKLAKRRRRRAGDQLPMRHVRLLFGPGLWRGQAATACQCFGRRTPGSPRLRPPRSLSQGSAPAAFTGRAIHAHRSFSMARSDGACGMHIADTDRANRAVQSAVAASCLVA
jgi:hypothetical protein